ncbi:hypothetical protein C3B59_11825 [Cryobacterium zongtaii]|uniref:Uncharacterized protein n=1 Tax=Cryobacterium zongtaii TaxID=1259217 RepID=A0A2S3Z9H6_9MICO|nr:hypothetical protein [Cryobacterium zongtaii]POH62206.1 hypothetical protein C3B59_11825 [Cryobacterium zongtaii]
MTGAPVSTLLDAIEAAALTIRKAIEPVFEQIAKLAQAIADLRPTPALVGWASFIIPIHITRYVRLTTDVRGYGKTLTCTVRVRTWLYRRRCRFTRVTPAKRHA